MLIHAGPAPAPFGVQQVRRSRLAAQLPAPLFARSSRARNFEVIVRIQVVTLVVILILFWAAFVLYPAPPANFDYTHVGVPQNWDHNYTGFLSHWNKNSNLSWAFDVWFLNLFPREHPFVFNEGGWSTLSFIPTLATMILGLLTGEWLKSNGSKYRKLRGMAVAGILLLLSGLVFQWAGICPIVKRV